jgi:hypothetical protein
VYADPAGHPFCLCIQGALSQDLATAVA